MKLGELIDLRKVKMTSKVSVAAGKQSSTVLGTVGITIGQEQSTGDTSRVNEAMLQGLMKKAMKQVGTLASVLGDDAEEAAEILHTKTSDKAYVVDKTSPMFKTLMGAAAEHVRREGDSSHLKVLRFVGNRKAVARGDVIVTDSHTYNSLVESCD